VQSSTVHILHTQSTLGPLRDILPATGRSGIEATIGNVKSEQLGSAFILKPNPSIRHSALADAPTVAPLAPATSHVWRVTIEVPANHISFSGCSTLKCNHPSPTCTVVLPQNVVMDSLILADRQLAPALKTRENARM
jgi:hypothetical protein